MSDLIQQNASYERVPPYSPAGGFGEDADDDYEEFIPARKMSFAIPRRDRRRVEESAYYLSVVDFKLTVRRKPTVDRSSESDGDGSIRDDGDRRYPVAYVLLGYLVFILLATGVVATALAPSAATQLGVPLGLTLWAILAFLIRKRDQRNIDA